MAGRGQVISCDTLRFWNQQYEDGIESNKLVVVEFTATFSGQFLLAFPVLNDLARELIDVLFLMVDVNKLKSVADKWRVKEIPTFYVVKEGTPGAKTVGEKKDALLMNIAKVATATGNPKNILYT